MIRPSFVPSMKASESKYCKCPYFLTNALARKIEKLAAESWRKAGLSPSHAYVLMLVLEEPGLQPGSIAHHLQLTPSTITRLIEKLEEKKLVMRTTEGKLTNVYPTPKARESKPLLKECVDDFQEKYAKLVGKEETKQFMTQMTRIVDRL
jgi:DNA-binding MarR family transcriptional regulator